MASFSTKFNVADQGIEDGAAWTALDSTGVTDDAVTIVKNRAGCPQNARSAVAWYDTTKPATADQECGAMISASVQGSSAYVDVGVLGKAVSSSLSTAKLGLWARFSWLANGARRIAIHRFMPDDSASSTVAQANLVLAGGVESDAFVGVLDQAGALNVPQLLRVVAVANNTGYRVRVFLNNSGDERPVLEAQVDGDFTGTSDATQPYGKWWIGFGPNGSASHGTTVAYVYGLDYSSATDHARQELRPDQVSLGVLRAMVKTRYGRGMPTSLSDEVIDDALRNAMDGVISELGLSASFLWREEALSLSPNTTTGRVTLQANMREIIAIEDSSGCPARWSLLAYDTNGAPIILLNSTAGTYKVRYLLRHSLPTTPGDTCPVPREHVEAVVLGACYRIAFGEPRMDLGQALHAEYRMAFDRLVMAMARQVNATRPVLSVPLFNQGYGVQAPWSRL